MTPTQTPVPDLTPTPALLALNAALIAAFGPALHSVRLQVSDGPVLTPAFLMPEDRAGNTLMPLDLNGVTAQERGGEEIYVLPDGDLLSDVIDEHIDLGSPVGAEQEVVDYLFSVKEGCGFAEATAWIGEVGSKCVLQDEQVISVPLLHASENDPEARTALMVQAYLLEQDVLRNAEDGSGDPDFAEDNARSLGASFAALLHRSPPGYTVLTRPLTLDEIRAQAKPIESQGNWISGVYAVSLGALTGNFEEVLDRLSEVLTDTGLLQDVSYRALGIQDDGRTLHLEISGDAVGVLENGDEVDEGNEDEGNGQ